MAGLQQIFNIIWNPQRMECRKYAIENPEIWGAYRGDEAHQANVAQELPPYISYIS